ncbi:MAG: hypothetical protein ACPGWR_17265, partial [Ardenticatenaceae bacterium]
ASAAESVDCEASRLAGAAHPFNPFPKSVDSNPFNSLSELASAAESVDCEASRLAGAANPFNPLPELASAAESVDSNLFRIRTALKGRCWSVQY